MNRSIRRTLERHGAVEIIPRISNAQEMSVAGQKKGWNESTQITGVIRRYDNPTAGSYTKDECHIGTNAIANKLGS